jgi:hypothetical protein
MALYASWIHGNALTVESPQSLSGFGHFGWGTDMRMPPDQASWFHIPIPTPVIVADKRTRVQTFFLLFKSENGHLTNIHIYDGSIQVQQFNNLDASGERRFELDGKNTVHLAQPHTVVFGMGLTFRYEAQVSLGHQVDSAHLIVAAAGGDFFI